MKHLAPSIFRAFACAAGACPDSCCRAGWEIVPDQETLALYETLPGPDGDRVRAGIVPACRGGHWPPETPDEPLLRQDGSRVCVLLDADGLCHVQRHFGHGALCRVCREYPRFHREFGNLTEHGLSLSCPTAYALATARSPAWEEWEDEAPIVPNELDPAAYLRLRKGRELALDLLAREELPLTQRLSLVRKLAAALQGVPERLVKHDYSLRLRRWESLPLRRREGSCPRSGTSLPAARPGGSDTCRGSKLRLRRSGRLVPARGRGMSLPYGTLVRRFLGLEILSPEWKDALERFQTICCERAANGRPCTAPEPEARTAECRPYTAPDLEPYARWLWYELYKYWLDALDDGRLLARVDRSLAMLALGMAMDRALPGEGPFLRRLSREIEHCEENLEALLKPEAEFSQFFRDFQLLFS